MNLEHCRKEKQSSARFGFWSLAVWAGVGVALETVHALKWSIILDHHARRELLTWAHAHGVGLSLVVLAYGALGVRSTLSGSTGVRLRLGAALLPLGFLFATFGQTESDPGPAILAVPVGALLVLASLVEIAMATRHPAE